MFIPPFLAGVIITVLVELVVLTVAAIFKKDDEGDGEL